MPSARATQAVQDPAKVFEMMKAHFQVSWLTHEDLFGIADTDKGPKLQEHSKLLNDLLAASAIYNKMTLIEALKLLDEWGRGFLTKDPRANHLESQAFALKLLLMEIRVVSTRASEGCARQPEHMRQLIEVFRRTKSRVPAEDSPASSTDQPADPGLKDTGSEDMPADQGLELDSDLPAREGLPSSSSGKQPMGPTESEQLFGSSDEDANIPSGLQPMGPTELQQLFGDAGNDGSSSSGLHGEPLKPTHQADADVLSIDSSSDFAYEDARAGKSVRLDKNGVAKAAKGDDVGAAGNRPLKRPAAAAAVASGDRPLKRPAAAPAAASGDRLLKRPAAAGGVAGGAAEAASGGAAGEAEGEATSDAAGGVEGEATSDDAGGAASAASRDAAAQEPQEAHQPLMNKKNIYSRAYHKGLCASKGDKAFARQAGHRAVEEWEQSKA